MNQNHDFIREHLESAQKISSKLLKGQFDQIHQVIEALFDAWISDRQIFAFGNGGSHANASHFVADLMKTVVSDPMKTHAIRAICLGDNPSLISALINDTGWQDVYEAQLRTLLYSLYSADIVIAYSVHGGSGNDKAGAWSQNILRALQYAKKANCLTIGFSGFDGGPMSKLVDISIVVPAESTPLVESFHYLLNHLIVFRVKELIAKAVKKGAS